MGVCCHYAAEVRAKLLGPDFVQVPSPMVVRSGWQFRSGTRFLPVSSIRMPPTSHVLNCVDLKWSPMDKRSKMKYHQFHALFASNSVTNTSVVIDHNTLNTRQEACQKGYLNTSRVF